MRGAVANRPGLQCSRAACVIGGMIAAQSPFWRHIAACNAMPDEARLLAFHMAGQRVGWLLPEAARVLTFFPQHVHFDQQWVALAARLRSAPARSFAQTKPCSLTAGALRGRTVLLVLRTVQLGDEILQRLAQIVGLGVPSLA